MTDGRTDEQTDRWTDEGDCNIPDAFLKKRGDNKYLFDMVTDKQFQTSRTVLMSKRKELKQKRKDSKPQASEPITPSEEKRMAEKGCIGLTSPKQLQNKMWLQNAMLLGLPRGNENHRL